MASVREPCEGSRHFIENGCKMAFLNSLHEQLVKNWNKAKIQENCPLLCQLFFFSLTVSVLKTALPYLF